MVGYVLSKFPQLSTTFILNELLELEAQGVELQVFSLLPPTDRLRHPAVGRLKATVRSGPVAGQLPALLRRHWELRRTAPQAYRRGFALGAQGGPVAFWRFLQSGWVAWEARRLGVTHLHAHFAHHPSTVAWLASQLSGIPFSFTAHAMDLFRADVDRPRLIQRIQAARFVATVSAYNVGVLRELAPAASSRIVEIPNGIDLDYFTPAEPPPASPFRIVSVARLVEKKGIAVLLDACDRLRHRHPDFQCEIVGAGPLRRRLQDQIDRAALNDRVRLLGPATQDRILEYYRGAHAFVLPCIVARNGDRDGLPVALVEALACGLPVISTPVTGIPEVVRDGHNGRLVPSGDAEALAAALAELGDPALRGRLAVNARASVERFDRRRTVARLRTLLLEGDRATHPSGAI